MEDIILLKQGEIVLKGLNRRHFEQKLMANAARVLRRFGEFKIYTAQSTVYVEPQSPDCDMDSAFDAMLKIFGVTSVSRAAACAKDKDNIFEVAKEYLRPAMNASKSFKVETKRADKRFPMTSIQLSQYVGGLLAEEFPKVRVDVHNPELLVNVEVRDFAAYVHAASISGAGGLPVGTSGRAVTLLSGGIDSPVASWMIAKRGVQLIPVHFFSFPYTSELARQKVLSLAGILTAWCGRMTVEIVPFTAIQERIREKCPEEYFTIIMRRFMMRIAEKIALSNGCKAIVTGENLGQVASQTMEAMGVTERACTLPVLRPCVGLDKEEIIRIARKIGTFDTSILPYEDCCTVFTPRRPKTKPKLEDAERLEAAMDAEALAEEAFMNIERVRLEP